MIATAVLFVALQTPTYQAAPDDVKSEDAIIKAVYDVISGPAGQKRNWDRMRSLFAPKGTLSAIVKNREGQTVLAIMTPDQYAKGNEPYFDKNAFYEREVKRKALRNGKISMVFSEYESRHALDDKKPFDKGTNSLQLYTDGARWYVYSLMWAAN